VIASVIANLTVLGFMLRQIRRFGLTQARWAHDEKMVELRIQEDDAIQRRWEATRRVEAELNVSDGVRVAALETGTAQARAREAEALLQVESARARNRSKYS
jgi:hypothetical protein